MNSRFPSSEHFQSFKLKSTSILYLYDNADEFKLLLEKVHSFNDIFIVLCLADRKD